MKALPLALLVLLLGAGALFLTLDRGGRGRGREEPPLEVAGTSDAGESAPTAREPSTSGTPLEPVEPVRRAVESGSAPTGTAVYQGTVIGEGAPVEGVELALLVDDAPHGAARTDARGRFELRCAPLREVGLLRVQARGFAPIERVLEARPAGGTVLLGNIRLLRGQRVVGQVVDAGGAPVADAWISAEPPSSGRDVLVARARSGAGGEFELRDAAPGALRITARADGLAERTVQYEQDSGPLVIRLEPGRTMRLLVRSPRGPVEDAEVSILSTQANLGHKRVGKTDAEGRVVFDGLAATTWNARVSHPEYRPGGDSVVADGREKVLTLRPWPALGGVVRVPGGGPPPAGTRVYALPAAAPGDRLVQDAQGPETDEEGRFRLTGLRPGSWRIIATAPGFAPTRSVAVQLAYDRDGDVGTIELVRGATLLVRPTLNGKPLPGAEVEVLRSRPTDAQLWAFANASLGARHPCDAEGVARIENVEPGSLWLGIYAERCPPASSGPHAVLDTPAPFPIEVPMVPGGRLRGRVLDAAGQPVPQPRLRIVEKGGAIGFPLTVVGDDEGRYASSWLPPGSYTIEAFARGAPEARAESGVVRLEPGREIDVDLHL